jgi:penicillin-binding protein 1A
MQVVRGYAVLANGGYLVQPYFISKIEDHSGNIVFEAEPELACQNCDIPVIYADTPRSAVLSEESVENVALSRESRDNNVPMPEIEELTIEQVQHDGNQKYAPHVINTPLSFLIRDALNSNIFGEPGWKGTGWTAVREVQRNDIGGKTGTTNNSKDAWFSGYGTDIVTSVWIGFDDHRRTLGSSSNSGTIDNQISGVESGAKTAQPAWNSFMKAALKGAPEKTVEPPKGIVSVIIDKTTGKLSNGGENSRPEYFIEGTQPAQFSGQKTGTTITDQSGETHELF